MNRSLLARVSRLCHSPNGAYLLTPITQLPRNTFGLYHTRAIISQSQSGTGDASRPGNTSNTDPSLSSSNESGEKSAVGVERMENENNENTNVMSETRRTNEKERSSDRTRDMSPISHMPALRSFFNNPLRGWFGRDPLGLGMMNRRNDPFRMMEEMMTNTMRDFFDTQKSFDSITTPIGSGSTALLDWDMALAQPAHIALNELDDRFELKVTVKGFEKKDLKVRISEEENMLSITGQKEISDKKGQRHARYASHFVRAVPLPDYIDKNKIKVRWDDKSNSLNIDLPKLQRKIDEDKKADLPIE